MQATFELTKQPLCLGRPGALGDVLRTVRPRRIYGHWERAARKRAAPLMEGVSAS